MRMAQKQCHLTANYIFMHKDYKKILHMPNNDILRKMYKNGSLVSVVNISQEGMTMPSNIETWSLNAYGQPTSIELKSGVASIPEYWQTSNHALSSVTIPNTLKSIGSSAFADCTSLVALNVPSGTTSIGYGAFNEVGCSAITIPNTVTTIGSQAFSHNVNTMDITNIDLSNVIDLASNLFSMSHIKGNITITNDQLSGSTSGYSSSYAYGMFNNAYVTDSGDTLNITVYADGRILPQNIFNFATYASNGTINIRIYGTPTYLSPKCLGGGTEKYSITFVDCTTPPDGNTGTSSSSPFYNFGGTVYVPNSTALTRWKNKYTSNSSHFKVIGT